MTRLQIRTYIKGLINDNTTGAISAKDVQDSLMAVYDGTILNAGGSGGVNLPIDITDVNTLDSLLHQITTSISANANDISALPVPQVIGDFLAKELTYDATVSTVNGLPSATDIATKNYVDNKEPAKVTAVVSDPSGLATRAECITAMVDNSMDWTKDNEFFITETSGISVCLVHYHALGATNEQTAGKFFIFAGKLAV